MDEIRSNQIMIDMSDNSDPFAVVRPNSIVTDEDERHLATLEEENELPEQELIEESEEEFEQQEIEESSENPETEDSEESSEEENLYFHAAQKFKQDGFIDPEFELKEDIDGMSVYNAYKEKLHKDIAPIVRQEELDKLANEGWTPEDLVIARAMRQGIDYRLLQDASRYEIYSKLPDETSHEDKVAVITDMYRQRNFTEEEIKDMISVAEQRDDIDRIFDTSRKHFGTRYQDFVKAESEAYAAREAQRLEEVKRGEQLLNKIVSSHELYGEKLTPAQAKELNDSVRLQSQIVEVDGSKHKASELQKFLVDFYNNPEFRLYAFKLFKFRETDKEQIKGEARKEVENDFLAGMKKKTIKSNTGKLNRLIGEELNNKNSKGKGPVYLDFT